jgi:hypothetical protein
MTAIEELKESTRDSLAAKQRTLSKLAEQGEEENLWTTEFRDTVLDVIGDSLAIYRVTVAQARAAQSVEEVAVLWQETHADFASTLRLLQALEAAIGEPLKDELFAYYRKTIEKLERASAQAYEFHA